MVKIGNLESDWLRRGIHPVGVDEVGKGCLAGPVYAGAAKLDYNRLAALSPKERSLIRDSKTLSAKQRQESCLLIEKVAISYGIGVASPREIESLGISRATFLAMERALAQLTSPIEFLAIDGRQMIPGSAYPQQAIVKGDNSCYCIAAAAILAKEARDSHMVEQAALYPAYGFQNHVGYGTREHLQSIHNFGPCPLHRKNFAPIKDLI